MAKMITDNDYRKLENISIYLGKRGKFGDATLIEQIIREHKIMSARLTTLVFKYNTLKKEAEKWEQEPASLVESV